MGPKSQCSTVKDGPISPVSSRETPQFELGFLYSLTSLKNPGEGIFNHCIIRGLDLGPKSHCGTVKDGPISPVS